MRESDRPMVTSQEAAASLGVHPETIRRWARTRRLPARKTLSGYWLFDQGDIDTLAIRVEGEGPVVAA